MNKRGNFQNKKALEHVEIIISFAIFFAFIIFLGVILLPIGKGTLNPAIMNIVTNEILQNVGVEANVTTLILPAGFSDNCFNVSLSEIGNANNSIAKDFSGNLKEVSKDTNYVYINTSTNERVYYLYNSEIFAPTPSKTYNCAHSGSVGSISEEKYISHEALINLNKSYYGNYSKLKTILEIPDENDFSFIIMDNSRNETIVASRMIPDFIDVLSRDMPIEVLKNDSSTYLGFMNVKVW